MWQLCAAMMSWVRCWVGCLLKDSELFILFAENSQILLKISVNFHVSGSTWSVSKLPTQLIVQLNSSLWQIIDLKFWSLQFQNEKKSRITLELKVKSALWHINVTIIDCSESGSKELRANVDIIRTLESSKVQTILFTSFDNK